MNFQYCYDQITSGKNVHVPIDKIDGVDVSVNIVNPGKCEEGCTCKKPKMYFLVDYTNSETRTEKYAINNQEEFDIIVAKITCWEFDKLSNKFVDGSEHIKTIEFYSCFMSPKIQLRYDECCVCLEKTSGKTKCNHPICLSCFTNLKKPKCPLCRENIYEDGNESDDE